MVTMVVKFSRIKILLFLLIFSVTKTKHYGVVDNVIVNVTQDAPGDYKKTMPGEWDISTQL